MKSNVQKTREALENSNGLLEELSNIGEWGESAKEQIAENKSALDLPLRNCDVGTAEEQFKRFLAFCRCQTRGCRNCPANVTRVRGTSNCDLAWSQMPYEAEKGDAE